MPTGLEQHDDDAMQEILRRAIHKEAAESGKLRDRLLAAADELGISHNTVLQAENEYREETERARDLAAYAREQRKGFRIHLAVYVSVNLFLILMNLLTSSHDRTPWALFPLLGWGIGLVCHAIVALSKPDWHSEEFQSWRRDRKALEEEVKKSASNAS